MARQRYPDVEIPGFSKAPPVILVSGGVEFFVEEAAAAVAKALAGEGAEVELLRFEDDAPAEAVSDALLNKSLFSAHRLVELDVSRLLGTDSPGSLVVSALEAWERGGAGGRREAFRHTRALLAALELPAGGDPAETAEAAAKKTRKKDAAPVLAEILRELPEEKSGGPAVLKGALRALLARGAENDGTVALLRAVSPPSGVDLLQEIATRGLVIEVSVGEDPAPALRRLLAARAREREVSFDAGAIERLLKRTDQDPAVFAAELEKLLAFAGQGGRVRAADVESNVEDEASEDVYLLFDAIGRRDANEALTRLERLFDGRDVRQGSRAFEMIEEIWPQQLLGLITGEIRRMLLLRARLEEGPGGFDAGMPFPAFEARVLPRLQAPVPPFGRSPFEGRGGGPKPYALYKASQRASRYSARELARALSRAADVDVQLKTSAPVLETLSVYVGQLIAGA